MIKRDTSQKNAADHETTSAGNVATWVTLKCVVTPNRAKSESLAAVRVVVVEIPDESKVLEEEEETSKANGMYAKLARRRMLEALQAAMISTCSRLGTLMTGTP